MKNFENHYEIAFARKLWKTNRKRNVLIISNLMLSIVFSTLIIYFFQIMLNQTYVNNTRELDTALELFSENEQDNMRSVLEMERMNMQTPEESIVPVRMGVFFVVAIIIFLLVYSVYYFAMVKDLKLFARLRLLGMRKKQVENIAKLQALWQFAAAAFGGVAISLGLSFVMRFWMQSRLPEMGWDKLPQPTDYLLGITVIALAMWAGVGGPIRMMSRLSGIQAYRYDGTKIRGNLSHRPHRFSATMMALRNIRRTWKRCVLVAICSMLVMAIFVMNSNLYESIGAYTNHLYETEYDFLVVREDTLLQMSDYEGIEQIEDMEVMDRLGWTLDMYGECTMKLDKEMGREIAARSKADEVIYYFSGDVAIDQPAYLGRIEDAVNRGVFSCTQERDLYQLGLDTVGFVPQQQYYVDFAELEKCTVVEGTLDRRRFEAGGYAVVIWDELLESEPLYHAGDKMPVGRYDHGAMFDEVWWSESPEQKQQALQSLSDSIQEVEVMAVVRDVPSMYPVTGNNACFLPVNFTDVWTDDNIMLYGLTMEAKDVGVTEAALKKVMPKYEKEEVTYLSEAAKAKKRRENTLFLKVVFGVIDAIVFAMGAMNLLNNCVLGLLERREEYTTLHAIGMTKRDLLAMIHRENAIIVGTGAVIGYVIGLAASRSYVLWSYSGYVGFEEYVRVSFWPGIVLGLVLMLMSCLYPRRKTRIYEKES